MTIDLAPGHKVGLPVFNPILLAAGTIGYGEVAPPGLVAKRLGGVVVGPIMRSSRRGADPPRLAEFPGGAVLAPGLQTRGVSNVLKRYARLWPRLGCPVIAQIGDTDPQSAAQTAERLSDCEDLAGLELRPSAAVDGSMLYRLVESIRQRSDLPVWVKLPWQSGRQLAAPAVDAGASALVVAQAPVGMGIRSPDSLRVRGELVGPAICAQMLALLADVADLALPCALIACGGIHTAAQVSAALELGAQAVQIDSAIWVEPGLPVKLADRFSTD